MYLKMMLHEAYHFMLLFGMVFGQDKGEIMNEESNEESPETIVGGSQLSQEDRAKRPFLVNVGKTSPTTGQEIFSCGGSVISPSAILTAAHCLYSHNPTPWTWDPPQWIDFFRYDKTDAVGTNGLVRIPLLSDACVPHPDFQPWNTGNPYPLDQDVAICFLSTPAPAGATPITLNADQNVPESSGVPLDIAGWGTRAEDDHPIGYPKWWFDTTVPFVTTLNYITTQECEIDPYNWRNHVTASMMCAFAPGTAMCHGDSGGPLTLGKGGSEGGMSEPALQVGIASHHGQGNCLMDTAPTIYPGVFARVSNVFDWITSTVCTHTNGKELCPDEPCEDAQKLMAETCALCALCP